MVARSGRIGAKISGFANHAFGLGKIPHTDIGQMAAHSPTANTPAHAAGSPGGHDDVHESFIKTPKQLIVVVTLALVVPVLLIILLAHFVSSGKRIGAGTDAMTAEAIEARIKPIAGFVLRDASAPTVARSGEEVYKAVCSACHAAGVANAPKTGDTAAWAPRIQQGLDVLITSALKGKGAMAAQGGGEYSDLEVTKAVVHLANGAGGTFEEPK